MIKLDFCILSRIEDQIIHADYVNGSHIEEKHALELIAAYEELARGDRIFSLADLSGGKSITLESKAQALMSRESPFVKNGNVIATAVVLDSLPSRMIAKFFMTFHRPVYSMKIKSNHAEAKAFFKKILEKERLKNSA